MGQTEKFICDTVLTEASADLLGYSEDRILPQPYHIGQKGQGLYCFTLNADHARNGIWHRAMVISSAEANLKETNSHRVFLIAHPTAKVINPSFLKGTLLGVGEGTTTSTHSVRIYSHQTRHVCKTFYLSPFQNQMRLKHLWRASQELIQELRNQGN